MGLYTQTHTFLYHLSWRAFFTMYLSPVSMEASIHMCKTASVGRPTIIIIITITTPTHHNPKP